MEIKLGKRFDPAKLKPNNLLALVLTCEVDIFTLLEPLAVSRANSKHSLRPQLPKEWL